jgi:hypothetical protein
MYYTLKNTFGGAPTDGGGTMAGGVESSLGAYSPGITKQAADVGGLTWAQRVKLGETGGLTSPGNAYADKPVSILDYFFK